jgi:redox-sensitive bicupin YhaK (pirin superfamily)
MITVIKNEDRYEAHHGWLRSYHLFSFADYYDLHNMNFGSLRVFNDDYIDGKNGFGAHPHRDMEIVTIMLTGELSHADTMGNTETIKQGEVQYMSAGTGVMHSEINNSSEQTHLYQIWFMPKERGLTPRYDQKDFSKTREKNVVQVLASGNTHEGAISIQGDATISWLETDKNINIPLKIEKGRGLFIYCKEGTLSVLGHVLARGDQARIEGEENFILEVEKDTVCILIEVGL